MKFKATEIATIIKQEIQQYRTELDVSEVGRVLEVGDGVARVYGLAKAMSGEMLEFASGATGVVFNLEETSIGAVVLGGFLDVKEGEEVRGTGKLLSVPVGEALIGRVVDPLGRPLDGKGPIQTPHRRPLEIIAPGIAERQPVTEPLQTGVKAVDSMIPIGRGQRELIIGDRKTGKTAIAIDTIINQRLYKGTPEEMVCVYVATGQKESTVAAMVEKLREQDAMDYTIVVVASASDPAPLQYISPYAGCAMAEYFMYEHGKGTLCVYDDLSKQAAAYRQLSLLLRRPPGREAYPGDVFYLHSRLLERSCKMAERRVIVRKGAQAGDESGVNNKIYIGEQDKHALEHDLESLGKDGHEVRRIKKSGGSLTALPVIETLEGEVSAYIPTNVISITDGQIYLEPDLFFAGVRPAINVGISVSRVGGNAQIGAMKKIAGSLRLDLARFRSLEAFAQLGTEVDPVTQRQIDRGRRMVELLKQPQYQPMDVVDQVLSIHAGARGFLDDVPLNRVADFERELLKYFRDEFPEVREELVKSRKLSDDLDKKMQDVVAKFKAVFTRSQK
jgi:F-type H+-transporting ATPase subunit alpha